MLKELRTDRSPVHSEPLSGELRFELTSERRANLDAAVSRLIPSDDGPGARETDVCGYIEQALLGRTHSHFAPLLERGLDLLDFLAQDSKGRAFVECSISEQDEILQQAQEFPNNEARRFFNYLLDLTIEGFLCDPIHGGNKGRLGWGYIGFEETEAEVCDSRAKA